jgi:hypothetical protein
MRLRRGKSKTKKKLTHVYVGPTTGFGLRTGTLCVNRGRTKQNRGAAGVITIELADGTLWSVPKGRVSRRGDI